MILSGGTEDSQAKLTVNYFSSSDLKKEWCVVLDDERDEAITGLAVGGDWVVVATSTNMLRFFTAGQHHQGYSSKSLIQTNCSDYRRSAEGGDHVARPPGQHGGGGGLPAAGHTLRSPGPGLLSVQSGRVRGESRPPSHTHPAPASHSR